MQTARPSVFLSYASEDRPAARLLRDALPGYGLEVWYDESDLGGGDVWDQKIRRQIRDCDYFMPLVSTQTERRHEGYFRREWRLALERTLDMADDHLYLLPVVIDDTLEAGARVPEKFLSVQWLKVPGGRPTQALESLCRRIASGSVAHSPRASRPRAGDREINSAAAAPPHPAFPVEEPGQKLRYWIEVAGWLVGAAWQQFNRLPKWVRPVAYTWLCITLLSRCNSSSHHHADEVIPPKVARTAVTPAVTAAGNTAGNTAVGDTAAGDTPADDTPRDSSDESVPGRVTPAKVAKLRAIAQQYRGTRDSSAVARLATAIAKEFGADEDAQESAAGNPLLAIAFTASKGDAAAAKVADASFAMTYGMIEISHRGQVGLTKESLASDDPAAAVERGKTARAAYVVYGTVAYAAGADPASIAADINARLPPF